MLRRLLPFCAVILAVAFAVLLSRSTSPVSRASARLAPTTTITTDTIVIPTYPYAAFLYTATNTTYHIPYQWLHWAQYTGSHPQPVNQTYTRLTLENEWLRVSLLPELGGRVYELIFKPTGNNELYRNTVIKPTNWGPPEQGWWLAAGGIEWGLPVEEHGYESAIPWMYDVITGADGITVTLRDSTQPDRLRAAISIFLPNNRAVLIVRPRIENDRNVDLNFKWWINAMLAPGPGNSIGKQGSNPSGADFKFIFPETQVTVHSTGDSSLPQEGQAMSWPIYNNREMSRVQNWNQWLGFFARPAASHDWVGVIDQAQQEGVVRVFPRSIAPGSKGFAMGWQNPIGSSTWTDDGSYYAELHGGLAPTFWDSAFLGAQQAIEWEETWYPFAGLNDLASANAAAALSLEQTGSQLMVNLHSTRPHGNAHLRVTRRYTCQVLGDYDLTDVQPGAPITRAIATTWQPQDVTVLYTTDDDQPLLLHQITNDGQPPTNVGISAPGLYVTQPEIPITLIAADWDCVRSFDVQVKDGLYGAWSDWLTGAATTIHTFTGTHGHTYFFRARARDFAGNVSAYRDDLWGDTYTSVLLSPAPNLELSYKFAPAFADADQPIEYTIVVNNTGALTAAATITDTLPTAAALISGTLSSSSPPTPTVNGNQIVWSGDVPTHTIVLLRYNLQPDSGLPIGTVLTNTVEIDGSVLPITRAARVIVNPYRVWLPLIAR
jgi:uncharacterized repeat protein (TIGR01451 family)